MHVAIVTAGGAGMFCGSCMLDNAWARAMRAQGARVSLVPTYTPIRVDEEDVSIDRVFLGGLNLYLDHRFRWWRRLPAWVRNRLDAPWLLRTVGSLAARNEADQLGSLTVEMLRGPEGTLEADIRQLTDYLCDSLRPDVICFSNALLSGVLPALRDRLPGPILCLLQGDDLFVQDLPEPYQEEVRGRMQQLASRFDGFLVHSRYYRDFMAEWLNQPADRFHLLPLAIDLAGHDGRPRRREGRPFRIGYFARVCPAKGLPLLVEAFLLLLRQGLDVELHVGGYLRKSDRPSLKDLRRRTRRAGRALQWIGSPDRRSEKVAFYASLDVLCVPTTYREPKGLPVLEAWANGVPVVQPAHGAFPELIASTGGGLLFAPGDATDLCRQLRRLAEDEDLRLELAQKGHQGVRLHHDVHAVARQSLKLFRDATQVDSSSFAPADRSTADDVSPAG